MKCSYCTPMLNTNVPGTSLDFYTHESFCPHTSAPFQEQIEWLHNAKRGLSHPTQAQYNTLWRTFTRIIGQ